MGRSLGYRGGTLELQGHPNLVRTAAPGSVLSNGTTAVILLALTAGRKITPVYMKFTNEGLVDRTVIIEESDGVTTTELDRFIVPAGAGNEKVIDVPHGEWGTLTVAFRLQFKLSAAGTDIRAMAVGLKEVVRS